MLCASSRDNSARCATVAPSMPSSKVRESEPRVTSSTRICCCAVGLRGKKADMSATKWLRATTTAHARTNTNQRAVGQRDLATELTHRRLQLKEVACLLRQ